MHDLRNYLNELYLPLDMFKKDIIGILKHQGLKITVGYYNGHFHKTEGGSYWMDYYPIPVISVIDLCDIEIDFDAIHISTKLTRWPALEYDYKNLDKYRFESYGTKDYLTDYYQKGDSIAALKQRISLSDESEIGFSFQFSPDTTPAQLLVFLHFLTEEKFYY